MDRDVKSIALRAAQEGGAILREYFGRIKSVEHKGEIDLVTEADHESEARIVSIIRAAYPAHRILAEETGDSGKASFFKWIIDPLDGTTKIEISRIDEVVARHGKHYLERIYTPAELEQCGKRAESLAGRFAAKEAVAKALGCGIGDVGWKEIEILGDEQHAPMLTLRGAAKQKADELGLVQWSVSISHSQSHSVAIVVMLG